MAATICIIIIFLNTKYSLWDISKKEYSIVFILSIGLFFSIFFLHIKSQKKDNYRDLPADCLTHNLGDIYPALDNVHTNSVTYSYYAEINRIYNSLEDSKDHFVMIPNNAIIYPVIKSKNPFPIDWFQYPEYAGSESQLISGINRALNSQNIYILVDKYDTKKMAFKLIKKQYPDDTYGYMDHMLEKCRKISIDSYFFDVYTNGN